MTEKKTFKNPYDVNTTVSGYEPSVVTHIVEGNKFPSSDWDMGVTFTKKVLEIQPGDEVRYSLWDHERLAWTVLAVYKDQLWITRPGEKAWSVPTSDVIL